MEKNDWIKFDGGELAEELWPKAGRLVLCLDYTGNYYVREMAWLKDEYEEHPWSDKPTIECHYCEENEEGAYLGIVPKRGHNDQTSRVAYILEIEPPDYNPDTEPFNNEVKQLRAQVRMLKRELNLMKGINND